MKTQRNLSIGGIGLAAGALACVGLMSAASSIAQASVSVSETLYPIDTGPPTGDVLPLGNTTTSAPGFGTSSWGTNYLPGGGKTELYLSPSASTLFNEPVSLNSADSNSLSSLSYYTDKLNNVVSDWYINIYTNLATSGNAASWYQNRFTFSASGSYNANTPTGVWNQATTGLSSDQLFVTEINNGPISSPDTPGLMTLSTLESSSYKNETIKYIVLTVASNVEPPTTNPGLNSLVDGLQFSLNDGSSATFNLEAVTPIPGSGLLAAVGSLALIGGLALRRRMAKIH